MIAEELKELFDDIKRELVGMKTDLVVLKYDLDQVNKKLDILRTEQLGAAQSMQENDPLMAPLPTSGPGITRETF